MASLTLAELLRVIADLEDLESTSIRTGVPADQLRQLLLTGAESSSTSTEAGKGTRPAAPTPTADGGPARVPKQASLSFGPADKTGGHWLIWTDGAARGNPGPSGAGAVLKGPGGVVERIGKFLHVQTNNVAEYQGVIIALKRALELGAQTIELRADSKLVIEQLAGRWKVKNAGLQPLWREARGLLGHFESARLEHVRREFNTEADEMSNRAIDEKM